MKFEEFKKQVVVEAGFWGVAIVVLLILFFVLDMFSGDLIEKNATLKREMNTLEGEISATKTKYANIKQNLALYEEIKKKEAKGELAINRQKVTEKFNAFKNQFKLSNLRLSLSALTPAQDPAFQRKTSQISYGEVTADMEAITDEHIYNMIKAMDANMPGITRINKLTLARDKLLTEDFIKTIREKGTVSLVKSQVKFIWYGIAPVETTDPAANPNALPPPVPQP